MNHRLTRRHCLLAAGSLGLPAFAQPETAPMQDLLEARLREDGVALAAGRLSSGNSEFAGAAKRGTRPDADSVFEVGSITKTFTALLLADAVVRGELKLEDAVEVDGIQLRDSAGQPLRWVDIATHRSGLPRLASNMAPANVDDPYADYDEVALRAFLKSWQPGVARASRFEYSNLGFGLLGHALALRQRTDYATLLTRRVLEPLGLQRHIGFGHAALLQGHDAQGKPVPAWHFQSTTAGAGALHGSARGLLRYADAAMGGYEHPLKAAFALCLQRRAAGGAPANPIGLAWLLASLNGCTLFSHDGGTAGFSSSLWLDPSRGRASVVLANAQVPVGDLALHLLDESVPLRDLAATRQASLTLPADQLQALAGVYAVTPQFKLTIRADGQRLFAQATGQAEFELFAKAPRRFFAKVTPLEIEFDADGKALTLFQGGATPRFVRE
ncbi:CubicO group peptidase (beta-lactamase class C family) [Pelomonas aquatica]|uniref:CubicO group peptidase (Beta-lactamase class C family) n=1 Tax=Pelomonas aquatica TaxID=431058 RepID=A0ABU1ZH59_9BURK|nr:serine hydrolase [Pelomonas aquatica]MDR7299325.1 CubicO group peptidase (beta-lactamase class C family) [Pelomonas aquatica]